MSKYYRVYADVDLDAIRANCIELMSKTEPSTKALAVVKADGYGHGDVAVSKAVRDLVYGYAVATLDEAVTLRENGINKPILILGYVEPEEYEALVKNEIDATVFDYETAKALNDVALRLGKVAFCHIKVDTGMRRIGLEPDESGVEIVKKIKNLKALNARGLFTHLATADEKDKTAALRQIAKYDAFDDALKKSGLQSHRADECQAQKNREQETTPSGHAYKPNNKPFTIIIPFRKPDTTPVFFFTK